MKSLIFKLIIIDVVRLDELESVNWWKVNELMKSQEGKNNTHTRITIETKAIKLCDEHRWKRAKEENETKTTKLEEIEFSYAVRCVNATAIQFKYIA